MSAIRDVERCAVIADDTLVWGSGIEKHNKRLWAVLQKANSNLKMNRSKLQIVLPNGLHAS